LTDDKTYQNIIKRNKKYNKTSERIKSYNMETLTIEQARLKLHAMGIKTYPVNTNVDYEYMYEKAEELNNHPNFPRTLANYYTTNNMVDELSVLYNQDIIPTYDAIRDAAESKFFNLLYCLYIAKPNLFNQGFINSFSTNRDLHVLMEFHKWNEEMLPDIEGANSAAVNGQTKVIKFLDEHGVKPDTETMLFMIHHFPDEIIEVNVKQKPWLLFRIPFHMTLKLLNLTFREAIVSIMLFYYMTIGWHIHLKEMYIRDAYTNDVIFKAMLFTYIVHLTLNKLFTYKEEWGKYRIQTLTIERTFMFFWLLRLDKHMFYDPEALLTHFHFERQYAVIGLIITGLILQLFLRQKISKRYLPLLLLFCCGYKVQIWNSRH